MNTIFKWAIATIAGIFIITDLQAQIIVKMRPARPKKVVVRPAAPSPAHIWVEEDWVPRGRRYRWHGGYWAVAPRQSAVWVPGHWEVRPRGEVWVPGYWR